ncbi:MAG: DnaD domain protein [Chloroflexi bacterium]|nr:DnaD domain protein [Chloroflexota bacterium]
MTFTGFPARAQATAIPNVFFSDLLPHLRDRADIGVALYAFRALQAKKGFPRYLDAAELAADPALAAYLGAGATPVEATLACALAALVDAGMLLRLDVDADEGPRVLYFLNAPADRRGIDAVRSGEAGVGRVVPPPRAAPARSNIFALYESLIGTISPLIAEELGEAERLYPPQWLEHAFREAAAQNARSWRYVSRILERWAIEGPDHAKTERDPAGQRYFSGKYGQIIKDRDGLQR